MKNPTELLLGTTWETFHIAGRKVGILQWTTVWSDNLPRVLVTRLHHVFSVTGQLADFEHIFSFRAQPGYPSHSYLLDTGDGAPLHVRFGDGEMICQVDDEITRQSVPHDVRPGCGLYPLLVTIPFDRGARVPFTRLDESTCTLAGPGELVAHGWEPVTIGNEQRRLWLVSEEKRGSIFNRYWLDEHRRICKSVWQGGVSYLAPSREAALHGLPEHIINRAHQREGEGDWTAEVEEWLRRNTYE